MILKTPKFWYQSDINVLLKCILYPISKIYSLIAKFNYGKKYKYKSTKSKVIAIGGITAGGSGKTIVVASICDILKKIDKKPAIISRGFGRLSKKTFIVDNKIHSFNNVGDEPLLLSQYADIFVGKDRAKSARLAEQNGYNLFILDDGITQKYLYPNIKIIVIDNSQKFGNGEMLPLGPNRLNFDIIKKDIDAVIIITSNEVENTEEIKSKISDSIPVIYGYLEQNLSNIKAGTRIFAFCGIGYPQKFFDSLSQKLNLVKTLSFPDHHPFSDNDIINLIDEAKVHNAKLVTTEKDLMRIPKRFHAFIAVVSVKIIWKDTAKLVSLLKIQN